MNLSNDRRNAPQNFYDRKLLLQKINPNGNELHFIERFPLEERTKFWPHFVAVDNLRLYKWPWGVTNFAATVFVVAYQPWIKPDEVLRTQRNGIHGVMFNVGGVRIAICGLNSFECDGKTIPIRSGTFLVSITDLLEKTDSILKTRIQ